MADTNQHTEHPIHPEENWLGFIERYGNFIAVGLIVLVVVFIAVESYKNTIQPATMIQAKDTLKSIGEWQLEYSRSNESGSYGSFQELKESRSFAERYTQSTLIKRYTLVWELSSSSDTVTSEEEGHRFDQFEIIAYPTDTRHGYLYTFAITEDRIVRNYNPANGNQFNGPDDPMVRTWDPIL